MDLDSSSSRDRTTTRTTTAKTTATMGDKDCSDVCGREGLQKASSFKKGRSCCYPQNSGASPRTSLLMKSTSLARLQTRANSFRNSRMQGLSSSSNNDDDDGGATMSSNKSKRHSYLLHNLFMSGRFHLDVEVTLEVHNDKEKVCSEEEAVVKKAVTFDCVHCRIYPVYLDDTPGVSKGPAMALFGWDYEEGDDDNNNKKNNNNHGIPVDEYEEKRIPHRRNYKELKLSSTERTNLLKQHGATRREIMAYTKRSNIARRKRAITLERIHNGVPEESIERIGYAVKRFLRLKKSSKTELKNIWNPSMTAAATTTSSVTDAPAAVAVAVAVAARHG